MSAEDPPIGGPGRPAVRREDLTFSSFHDRTHKVHVRDFGTFDVRTPLSLELFPDILGGSSLKSIVSAIKSARTNQRGIVWGLGGHVVKCGATPALIALLRAGFGTAVALNGGAAIHDFEIASFGETSEDVDTGLLSGVYGTVAETPERMIRPVERAWRETPQHEIGFGELVARDLASGGCDYGDWSVLATCGHMALPVTVHTAVGADTIHLHPSMGGAALGHALMNDFVHLANALRDISDGGVFINVGSAVVLPEVFLKCIVMLVNLGYTMHGTTVVNLDMKEQYRTGVNVLARPAADAGRALSLIGQHEILIPLIARLVLDQTD